MDRARHTSVGWQKSQGAAKSLSRGRNRKFSGEMVAPQLLPSEDTAPAIDPNLLVGPLYVPQRSEADRIKEQLGDITAKLDNTLTCFDDDEVYEEEEDPLLRIMRAQIRGLNDKDMQLKMNMFFDRYEDMSMQVNSANQERDEMLLQLADWFTTDHIDLDDIKSSLDGSDVESIKTSYLETITSFEKIKMLEKQIIEATGKGKPTKQLQKVKQELEKNVVDKFKVMKDMSMQTMKLKVSDDAPWKYAAQEVVSMLKNVRTENSEELGMISKKMQEMVDQLEKQALQIKTLHIELREKKEVVTKLTDENSDLSQDVAVLRARYVRYEKELEKAKQMIRSLHSEKLAEMEGRDIAPAVQDKSLAKSISNVLAVFDQPEHFKKRGSDPAVLRSQLRQYQDALDAVRVEYSRTTEEMDELQVKLGEKKKYITSIEAENEKLLKDIRRLRQEKRVTIAEGNEPAAGDSHQCEHCKCHIPEKDINEELEELKKQVQSGQDKVAYFKKLLADTEMKLSDAFKEISDLRMDRDPPPTTKTEVSLRMDRDPPPTTKTEPATAAPKTAPEPRQEKKPIKEESPKEAPPKPKPRPGVEAKYLESSSLQKPQGAPKLPPIEKTITIEEKIEEHLPTGLTPKQTRELKLYKAGDLQGRLNMLLTEIMEFVSEIGRMLHTDKDEEAGRFKQMKAYDFDKTSSVQKSKGPVDPREEEARQKKSQVMFSGQHACAKLRECYDMLSNCLELKHDEHEAIYRSFKISQQRNAIRKEVMMGRMPLQVLHAFDKKTRQKAGPGSLLSIYCNISYGGGPSSLLKKSPGMPSDGMQPGSSSDISIGSDESEAKLNNKINVLGIQRSRSDLDTHESGGFGPGQVFPGVGLLKERTQVFLPGTPDSLRRDSAGVYGNKQELRLGVAGLAKKGLIHLSTNNEDTHMPMDNFTLYGERQTYIAQPDHAPSPKTRALIKRKDILEQVRAGTQRLEEEEAARFEEEQMSKSLGDYTILDLQAKILEMTDTKPSRRGTPIQEVGMTAAKRKENQGKGDKGITLPAIKNLDPFAMKFK